MSEKNFETIAQNAFDIIELVEVAGITDKSFVIIRKKLLDLGNDIKRLAEKTKDGEK